jgi:hypothetical protein
MWRAARKIDRAKRNRALRAPLTCAMAFLAGNVLAWGPDGHAIVAEIAQRRLAAGARSEVERLLGAGHSLASEGSWGDEARVDRPETFKWHFVDIPLAERSYDAARDCRPTAKGDCIVAQLARVRHALHCGSDMQRREALRWAVHLVADLHQPMHAVADERGGNDIRVRVSIGGLRCPQCAPVAAAQNLHGVWDTSLIAATTWSWGAYVRRLEDGWLASAEARDAARGGVVDWTNETHEVARDVWSWTPADGAIADDYYRKALPVLDRQLGRAGVRLAAFLDDALASGGCARALKGRASTRPGR